MIAALSDFFILLISTSILGGVFFFSAQILCRIRILNAGKGYTLLRLVLFFHIAAPILTAFFFAQSAGAITFPSPGAELNYFHIAKLPIAYYFYDYYKELHFLPLIFAVWLTGFAITFSMHILQNHRFFRQLKKVCHPETNRGLEALKNQLAKEYHIRKPICLCRTELNISPFIAGVVHPVIYLPRMDIPTKHLEFILRHEMIHCHRKDIFFRFLIIFLKSIYWFNPFLHHFSRIFHEQCEISCDEVLLKGCSQSERLEYARCIADFAGCKQAGFSVGFQSRSTAERRIASIAKMQPHTQKPKRRQIKTVVFIAGATILFLATTALAISNSTALRVKLSARIEEIYFKPAIPNRAPAAANRPVCPTAQAVQAKSSRSRFPS